jgi:hypothetical protein
MLKFVKQSLLLVRNKNDVAPFRAATRGTSTTSECCCDYLSTTPLCNELWEVHLLWGLRQLIAKESIVIKKKEMYWDSVMTSRR